MKVMWIALLLSGGLLLAQDNMGANSSPEKSKSKDEITVRGCVSRASGDYILMRTDPAVTYELQASGKTRLNNYLGQRVEVTGTKLPTLSSSSDAAAREGSAAPVTLNVRLIKTIDRKCSEPEVGR